MRAFEEGCAAEVVYLSTLKSGEETDTCASLSSATTTQYVDREPDSRSTWRNVANLALPTRCVAPTLVISLEPNLFFSSCAFVVVRHEGDTAAAVKRRARPRKARIRFPTEVPTSAFSRYRYARVRVRALALGPTGGWSRIIRNTHERGHGRGSERSIWQRRKRVQDDSSPNVFPGRERETLAVSP